uniref:Uncharacterized protein n=1 Tax=Rangifer tarandus platyrhynchus TaxID=3082113 RepID=A0ACB0E2W3_RANTA|nr:unnamed protein product [Rangifer tarandus platyrhynchus]
MTPVKRPLLLLVHEVGAWKVLCESCGQLTRDQISECLPALSGELAAHPSVHHRRCPEVPESRSEARPCKSDDLPEHMRPAPPRRGDAGELCKGSEASQAMKSQEWECQHLTTKEGEEPKNAAKYGAAIKPSATAATGRYTQGRTGPRKVRVDRQVRVLRETGFALTSQRLVKELGGMLTWTEHQEEALRGRHSVSEQRFYPREPISSQHLHPCAASPGTQLPLASSELPEHQGEKGQLERGQAQRAAPASSAG